MKTQITRQNKKTKYSTLCDRSFKIMLPVPSYSLDFAVYVYISKKLWHMEMKKK